MRADRSKIRKKYNLDIIDRWDLDNDEWPKITAVDIVPTKIEPFSSTQRSDKKSSFAHFFLEDYRFERLWNNPAKYIKSLKEYQGVLAPDFSQYLDMPLQIQAFNSYRNKALACYWQKQGITVIPTISFSDEDSYWFSFAGIPKDSTIAISSVGIKRDKEAVSLFKKGVKSAIDELCPKVIVWYGTKIDIECNDVNIVYFRNNNNERMTNGR